MATFVNVDLGENAELETSTDSREQTSKPQQLSVRQKKRNNRKHSRKENRDDTLRTKEGSSRITKPKSQRKEKYSALNLLAESIEEDKRSRNKNSATVQSEIDIHQLNQPLHLPADSSPENYFGDQLKTHQLPIGHGRPTNWANVHDELQRSSILPPNPVNTALSTDNLSTHTPLWNSALGHTNSGSMEFSKTYPVPIGFERRLSETYTEPGGFERRLSQTQPDPVGFGRQGPWTNTYGDVHGTYQNDIDSCLGILHAKMDPEKRPECAFCKRNNAEDFYHHLKDKTGGVVCPVLSSFTCKMCAATGRNAHTHKYCPVNPVTKGDPVAAGMPPGRPLTKDDKMWLKYFHGRLILDLFLGKNKVAPDH